ncbi:MAG: NADPH-dependent glutamate synthase [Deltaproteobacteria bacterium]|nr:NADPH-dependent glutamate synthase [Deltaproteobacteria bacterium]
MNSTIDAAERIATGRVVMPQLPAGVRSRNFDEVNLGLSDIQAFSEARRCLQCKNRTCVSGCPVGVSIPEFINALASEDLPGSARILRGDNSLPAVCGRVCPQEKQCEALCVRGIKGEPVAIGYLERYVADWALNHPDRLQNEQVAAVTGKSVVVVGSGPAGLAAAGELARLGHAVTVFEALHDTGGVLRYGIPEFRLPKDIIDREVAYLIKQGVVMECNVIVGKTLTLSELRSQFDAVFIANGAGLPVMLNIPGENLKGVYAANEFLTRVNLMAAGRRNDSSTPIIIRREVAVIGGGNTAIDCVRTARRLGAERAMIVYRRGEAEMPARIEEIRHAKEEGVELVMLTAPTGILGNGDGWVSALCCLKMKLGSPDDSGRLRPVAIAGSDFELPAGVVIDAVGSGANPLLTATAPDLSLNKSGNILTGSECETSLAGVFAGGDIVRGGATVILAMGDGKRAASSIDGYLKRL